MRGYKYRLVLMVLISFSPGVVSLIINLVFSFILYGCNAFYRSAVVKTGVLSYNLSVRVHKLFSGPVTRRSRMAYQLQ